MASQRKEIVYFLVDLLTIGFCLIIGIILFVATLGTECCCNTYTRRLGSFLLHLLYGDSTQFVHSSVVGQRNDVFIEGNKIKKEQCCLHCCLTSNAIIFITLLTMVFSFFATLQLVSLEVAIEPYEALLVSIDRQFNDKLLSALFFD